MNWCYLFPLLVGLISAVLGYLLHYLMSKPSKQKLEQSYKTKNSELILLKSDYDKNVQEYGLLKSNYESISRKEEAWSANLSEWKDKYHNLDLRLAKSNNEKEDAEVALVRAKANARNRESELLGAINAANEKYNDLDEKYQSVVAERDDYAEHYTKLEAENEKLDDSQTGYVADMEGRLNSWKIKCEGLEQRYKETDREKDEVIRELERISLEKEALESQLKEMEVGLGASNEEGTTALDSYLEKIAQLESENIALKAGTDVSEYDKKIKKLKKQADKKEDKIVELETRLKDCLANQPMAAAAPIIQDDLKIVEGIGPKIEGLLNDANIMNWNQLSKTSVDDLRKILDDAGSRYRMHDPSTWPKQAELAAEGRFEALKKWQDELDGGRA